MKNAVQALKESKDKLGLPNEALSRANKTNLYKQSYTYHGDTVREKTNLDSGEVDSFADECSMDQSSKKVTQSPKAVADETNKAKSKAKRSLSQES